MEPKPSIFVIDDDTDIAEMLCSTLHDIFDVQAFTGGREAINSGVVDGWPSAIVVDLLMPDLNGLDTMTAARAKGFQGQFVICSGHADKEKALQALTMRAFAFIEKPFNGHELINAMKHAVFETSMTDIHRDLMQRHVELAESTRQLAGLYEERLAEAENLMFNVTTPTDERELFLDHKSYYKVFQQVTKRVDDLNFEIQQLQKKQDQVIQWRDKV